MVKPFTAIIWDPEVLHSDRVIEAINRAHTERCYRWSLRGLTFLPDGDLQGETVTDFWTAAANGAAKYVTAQIYPAGGADTVGSTGLNRLVQLTSSGGSTSMSSNGVRVAVNSESTGGTWYFQTAIRLVSGTGTVSVDVLDSTGAAVISPQVTRGSATNTWSTTAQGDFMVCEGTFDLPADCAEIAVRLSLSADTMVGQMGPVIIFPRNTNAFPLPNRLTSEDDIGNLFYGTVGTNPAGYMNIRLSEPITNATNQHYLDSYDDHMTLRLPFRVNRAVYYEEAVFGAALAGLADTTTFPRERIIKWAKYEFVKRLYERERIKFVTLENGTPRPSRWRTSAKEAWREASGNDMEPEPKLVSGRRR